MTGKPHLTGCKGTHCQAVFRRLLPRLGYQSAVWAIAHRLCRLVWKILHQGIRYIEQGIESEPKLLIYRAKYLAKQLRKFGYTSRSLLQTELQHKTRGSNSGGGDFRRSCRLLVRCTFRLSNPQI